MEIPETTIDKPYIEFRFTKEGKLKLEATAGWWGGINAGFVSSNGSSGNTCEPKDFEKYIKRHIENKKKEIDKQIAQLNKQKAFIEKYYKHEFSDSNSLSS